MDKELQNVTDKLGEDVKVRLTSKKIKELKEIAKSKLNQIVRK